MRRWFCIKVEIYSIFTKNTFLIYWKIWYIDNFSYDKTTLRVEKGFVIISKNKRPTASNLSTMIVFFHWTMELFNHFHSSIDRKLCRFMVKSIHWSIISIDILHKDILINSILNLTERPCIMHYDEWKSASTGYVIPL